MLRSVPKPLLTGIWPPLHYRSSVSWLKSRNWSAGCDFIFMIYVKLHLNWKFSTHTVPVKVWTLPISFLYRDTMRDQPTLQVTWITLESSYGSSSKERWWSSALPYLPRETIPTATQGPSEIRSPGSLDSSECLHVTPSQVFQDPTLPISTHTLITRGYFQKFMEKWSKMITYNPSTHTVLKYTHIFSP